MMKKFYNAAPLGSKRVKGISREVRVINLQKDCCIVKGAMETLVIMANPHKFQDLFYKSCNSLLGFDPHVQNVMVEALALYYNGEAFTLTGLQQVDAVLLKLYQEIDRELLNLKK